MSDWTLATCDACGKPPGGMSVSVLNGRTRCMSCFQVHGLGDGPRAIGTSPVPATPAPTPKEYCGITSEDGRSVCCLEHPHAPLACDWREINNTPPAPSLGCEYGVTLSAPTPQAEEGEATRVAMACECMALHPDDCECPPGPEEWAALIEKKNGELREAIRARDLTIEVQATSLVALDEENKRLKAVMRGVLGTLAAADVMPVDKCRPFIDSARADLRSVLYPAPDHRHTEGLTDA